MRREIDTNYTANIMLLAAFLPHLQSRGSSSSSSSSEVVKEGEGEATAPSAIIAVSSGLALVPLPRCANYCATKAALHALVWSLRAQLAADPASRHIRVIEIVPPAVQTELHELQDDMRAAGQAHIGISIEAYMKDCWAGLERGDEEILIGPIKENFSTLEDGKKVMFKQFLDAMAAGDLPK